MAGLRTTDDVRFAGNGLITRTEEVVKTRPSQARGAVSRRRRSAPIEEEYIANERVVRSDSGYWVDGINRPDAVVGSNTPATGGSDLAPRQEEAKKALLLAGGETPFVKDQRTGASRLEDDPQFLKKKLTALLVS